MQRLSRLFLVFWNIVFLDLEQYFIIIVICDPGNIFFKTFRIYSIRGCIDFNSTSTRVKVFLFILHLLKLLFRLFLSVFWGFYTFREVYRLSLLGSWLSLFSFMVFLIINLI